MAVAFALAFALATGETGLTAKNSLVLRVHLEVTRVMLVSLVMSLAHFSWSFRVSPLLAAALHYYTNTRIATRVTDAGNEKCTGCPDPDDNNGETTLSVASTNADNCTCSEGFLKLCTSNKCIR